MAALRYPEYRRFWLGSLAAVSGLQILVLAEGWLIYDLTGSPLYLGYAGLVTATPAIVLNLVGGVLADRMDQRKIILLTQAILGCLALSMAILVAT